MLVISKEKLLPVNELPDNPLLWSLSTREFFYTLPWGITVPTFVQHPLASSHDSTLIVHKGDKGDEYCVYSVFSKVWIPPLCRTIEANPRLTPVVSSKPPAIKWYKNTLLSTVHIWLILPCYIRFSNIYHLVSSYLTLTSPYAANKYYLLRPGNRHSYHDIPTLHFSEIAAIWRANSALRCFVSNDINLLVPEFIVYVCPIVSVCGLLVWNKTYIQQIKKIRRLCGFSSPPYN